MSNAVCGCCVTGNAPSVAHSVLTTEDEASVSVDEVEVEAEDLTTEDLEVLAESDPEASPVSYSGSDFDVEGLVRRMVRGDIVVPKFGIDDATIETEGFQRRFVWNRPQMDKFIESLLLGYPIPGIFLVQQTDKRYLVLDGQQRLTTLTKFYDDGFSLKDVSEPLKGLAYSNLDDEQKRTIDSTFVHATIVQTDGTADSLDTIYQIFERLNSGGTQLTAHEIRVALYAGPFVKFLTELNDDGAWRELYGRPSPRLRDQEAVLRFLAFFSAPGEYRRPLKRFLNDFVADHRKLERLDPDRLGRLFSEACVLLRDNVGRAAFRKGGKGQVNAAQTEAVLVGVARRLEAGPITNPGRLMGAIEELTADESFVRAISRATADEESVRSRLALASQVFAGI